MENNKKNKKGSALAFMLVIMTVVSILLVSILQYVSSQIKYGSYNYSKEEAFQIAEAGMNYYKWYLAHVMETRTTPQDVLDYWENGDGYGNSPLGTEHDCDESGAYIANYSSGSVKGKYCIEVTPPEDWSTIFTVKIVGWTDKAPETKRTIQARFRKPSFSDFMLVSDKQFTLGDRTETHGRVHSNEGVYFNGVAYNIVSSEKDTYSFDGTILGIGSGTKSGVWTRWSNEFNTVQGENVFQAGKQIGTSEGATHWSFPAIDYWIDYAKSKVPGGAATPTNNICNDDACYFNNTGEGREIILNGSTFTVCDVNSYYDSCPDLTDPVTGIEYNFCKIFFVNIPKYSIKSYARTNGTTGSGCSSCSGICAPRGPFNIPDNGVIYVENNAWVRGILGNSSNHKKVTIIAASPGKNIIVGHAGANSNILYSSRDGEDVLGLLAQNNIEIAKDSPSTFSIDGALMSRNGRVGRDFYLDLASFFNSSTINFYGSIVSYNKPTIEQVVFGSFSSGYKNVNFNFDNNLIYYPPPFFPTGVGYSLDNWEEL